MATLLVLCCAALAACGRDSERNGGFRYEPAPYATTTDGTPIGYDPQDCSLYAADRVLVTVRADDLDGFERWAATKGFVVRGRMPREPGTPATTSVLLEVPAGSVLAAVALVQAQDGVTGARRFDFNLFVPEATPTPAIACTPVP